VNYLDTINNDKKRCEYCGEAVDFHVKRCNYCGSLLNAAPDSVPIIDTVSDEVINDEIVNDEIIDDKETISASNGYESRRPISNGMKVFLTVMSSIIPGLGQIIGVIIAIILISSDNDQDRRSFGVALLIASVVIFVVACIIFFLAVMVIYSIQQGYR
jgi:hypothetical protein